MNPGQGFRQEAVAMPGMMEQYLPPSLRGRVKDFFGYATGANFLPLAAATTATDTIQVNTDADFLVVLAVGRARDPADPATIFADPPITVLVTTDGSGRNLFNRAIDWSTFFGDAELPGLLPYPKVISGGSQLSTQLTNLDAAQDFDVRITYLGLKIFPELERR